MKKATLIILLLAMVTAANSQTDPEYRMEIGAGVGVVCYEGDFNGNITKNMQPLASVLVRRLINPYMGLRATLSYGKLKGDSKNVKTYYPDLQEAPYSFNNTLGDLSVIYEYNFWPYGTGKDYRGAKRLTPFIMGGIGATYCKTTDKSVFTGNLPLGIGVKYKYKDRLNVGLEWVAHLSLSDELDGIKDPYGIPSSGLFKNTDCYTDLRLTLTYSFMAKCRTCHNADE